MKKFNLLKEIIVVEKKIFLQAIQSNKIFAITTNGEIFYTPFPNATPFVFQGQAINQNNPLSPTQTINLTKALGNNYQIVIDGERILIKAFSNWQELISINTPQALYDDTTADGVAEFAHKELENIGWHADEFGITYRNLIEVLEEKCDGILLCIEQEEPYQFSGLGFVKEINQAKEILFNYAKEIVTHKLENDNDFKSDILTNDEIEAAEFFGCKIA